MKQTRPDFMENAMRVVQEATGQRPKTKPPEDEERPEPIIADRKLDRRAAG